MADYEFTTEWHLPAPRDAVWKIIRNPQNWPMWWRGLESVGEGRPGQADAVGGIWRLVWDGALPYRLTVDIEITRVEPPALMEGRISGGLQGTGCWTLQEQGNTTLVRFDWYVNGPRPWMHLVAPITRPLFRWNHNVLMEAGRHGLNKHLGGN